MVAGNSTVTESDSGSTDASVITIVFVVCLSVSAFVGLILALRNIKPTRGRVWINHAYFAGVACLIYFLTPLTIAELMYNPLTVIIVGSALPIYESVRAVATVDVADDKKWLTYWVAHGSLQYTTYWMDYIARDNMDQMEWWFQLEFFVLTWLLLPFTDGAALIFDYITEPFLAPIATSLAEKCSGLIAKLVTITISASHVWFLWAAFAFFSAGFQRIHRSVVWPYLPHRGVYCSRCDPLLRRRH
jgi:hypothetical protein